MSRNGSGVFTVVNTFVSGNPITAAGHNQNWADLATEVTNSVAADGQTSMTGPLKASSGTNSLPSHTFASDPDTGGYRSGSNEYSVAAGGTQITKVSSAGIDVKTGTVLIAGVAAFPVPTAQIADAAVTLAKHADLAQNTFIGRYTASTGVPQALTLSTGLDVNTSTGVVTTTTNPTFFPGFLSGLTMSTAGSSATMTIAAGAANDSTDSTLMKLSAAISKTTSSWAVGTAAGGLDTGAIATSTWYHFYEIKRPDTGVVDVVFSLSASSPTLPTNYTLYRRFGSGKTNGSSQWILFRQFGDEFVWDVPVQDVNAATPGATTLVTLASVPTGLNVIAKANVTLTAGAISSSLLLQSGTNTSQSAGTPTGNLTLITQTSSSISTTIALVTNTSAQIRSQGNGVSTPTYFVVTTGWTDTRGR